MFIDCAASLRLAFVAGFRNVFVVRANQALDLILPISKLSEFNFHADSSFGVGFSNLLQMHHSRLSGLNVGALL